MLLTINWFLQNKGWGYMIFKKESITDLLNELVSTSMSLGGFVLAAMAIMASTKDNTTKVDNSIEAKTGKEFFYNSDAYAYLIQSFSWACGVYVIMFLFFSVVRTIAEDLDDNKLFNLTYFGLFISIFTLIRCIYLIQAVVKIK